ncbi:MAG: alkaline phytoceramidase, partial [Gemmatimonadetes bacterium]|nr:alkaline phytoceramidase [Gemmatimonadota bacterium]
FAERLDRRAGIIALLPLTAFGVFSVLYWHFTEQAGAGDLRYYIVAQGYPILFVPLMVRLLPSPYTRGSDFYLA